MIFENDQAVIDYIKLHQSTPDWVKKARDYSVELCALINGESFCKELISKIEHIESAAKANVREKYARDIKDFYQRLFLPIQNVFSSTGGVKNYQNGESKLSEVNYKKLLKTISNIRDGKSIERYLESQWMNLYHTDPSGVLLVTYRTEKDELYVYPTYQSINVIRHYIPKGQLVECILFEPTTVEKGKLWKVIDDKKQYIVLQEGGGERYTVQVDKTFEHPFGTTPVIINSNMTDKYGNRLSPVNDIIPISKEYARDQSIKTIYKFLQGFPKSWIMDMLCASCRGTKKNGQDKCPDCSGTGWATGKMDVADVARIPLPKEGDPTIKGEDIAGFVSPDIETWEQFNTELEWLENHAYTTMWGVEQMSKVQKTATEIHYDTQPQINKLNKYADTSEWIEWTITEWCANAIDVQKNKNEPISLIVYGRRYILEGIDTIQKKYESAKEAGDNNIILDGIFDELLTVKFKNDPEWMKQELKKASTEPYLHQSISEVNEIFGPEEAAKKVYFQRWWKNLTNAELEFDTIVLQTKFDTDFKAFIPTIKINQPQQTQFT